MSGMKEAKMFFDCWRSAILAALLILAGCSGGADIQAADQAVRRFHQMLGGQRYEEVWAQMASPELRRSENKERFVALLQLTGERLGRVRNATQQGWHVNFGPGGRVITLVYHSSFERGQAVEQFVFTRHGDHHYIAGYHINSDELLQLPGPAPQQTESRPPVTN